MKENLYDLALSGVEQIVESVSESIAKEFKGVNPFDKKPIKNEDLLYDYNTRGFETFKEIADTQGIEAAIQYRNDMEKLKQKFGGEHA